MTAIAGSTNASDDVTAKSDLGISVGEAFSLTASTSVPASSSHTVIVATVATVGSAELIGTLVVVGTLHLPAWVAVVAVFFQTATTIGGLLATLAGQLANDRYLQQPLRQTRQSRSELSPI